MRLITIILCLLAAALPARAVDESDLLPADEAFALSAEAASPESVRLTWQIAEGYYLYRHRFGFESATANVTLGEATLPDGEPHEDEFFGKVETYRGSVSATLPVTGATPGQRVEIRARSQGCADLGVCYPPHEQSVAVTMPVAATPKAGPGGGDLAGRLGLTGNAAPAGDALPVDQAFVFEAIALAPDVIGVRFQVSPGYYLYRDKFEFFLEDAETASLESWSLPPGEPKTDEHFGDVRVFYDLLEVALPVSRHDTAAADLTLVARYQGCKEDGICYPPQERRANVPMPEADAASVTPAGAVTENPGTGAETSGGTAPVSEQDRLADTLLNGNLALAMLVFFVAGLLLAFTPCVFPMVPILAGILAGEGDDLKTRRAFMLSLVYVLAMSLTYTAAGVIAGVFGQNLQAVFQQPWILVTFSAVFVALALSMFGFYELQLPARLQTRLTEVSNRQGGGRYTGVAVMGFLSALIVGPCVAPPLAAAFIVIGQQGDPLLGGAALFALSIGMGMPLLLLGASAGKLLPRAGPWMDAVKRVFGVLLLALAIWMLERIVSPFATMLLWGALFVVTAVYLGALERLPDDASGWRRLWKGLGVLLLIAGIIEWVGAAAGGRDWMQPLRGVVSTGAGQQAEVSFEPANSIAQLESALARAERDGRPVLLDVYADWCVDCKRMERYTFPDPAVRQALGDTLLLKADVTANNEQHQALLQRFGLIGPPATLFFTPNGEELKSRRVIGFMDAESFAGHVRSALETKG